jgi:hypothetical protein
LDDQIEKNKTGRTYGTYGECRGAYNVLVGKPELKRPLGRHRREWKDNIKIDFLEVRWEAWTGLIWLRIGTVGRML